MKRGDFLDFLADKIDFLNALYRVEAESGWRSVETGEETLRLLEQTGDELVKFAHSDPPAAPWQSAD